jgi:beta-N-acetylhexosaminidase
MQSPTLSASELPLEAAVGQCLMVGFPGTEPPEDLLGWIARGQLGGIVLFTQNVGEPAQVRRLCEQLQEAAAESPGAVPLMISVDQEGGWVARLSDPFTVPPLAGELAIEGHQAVSRIARQVALELRSVGITMNLAPVLDVNTNLANPIIAERAFSDEPQECARLGVAYIESLQGAGCAGCGKHFPGHGDTVTDSHQVVPVVTHDLDRLKAVELVPFRAAAEAGVAAIMSAHILLPRIDPEAVATLSQPVIEGLLRKELGYEGCVITDDLDMRAVADEHTCEEAAVMALRAGCDVALVCGTEDAAPRMHAAIMEALSDGTLSEERIRQACGRVLAPKGRFAPPPAEDLSEVEARLGLG